MARIIRTAFVAYRRGLERRVPFWPADRIRFLQERRLRSIVRHAYDTVPFYQEAMRRLGLRPEDIRTVEDLARLPLIDSRQVLSNPSAFLSRRYLAGGTVELHSTGTTTRVPRVIHWDCRSAMRGVAFGERDREVLYRLLGKRAGLRRVSLHPVGFATRALAEHRASRLLVPSWVARTSYVPPELPYEEIARRLDGIRPDVVYSYGSFAAHFAEHVTRHALLKHPPQVWVTGADPLPTAGRELLEKTMGCRVHSTYQSVEGGRMGFLCERKEGFHLNVDLCAVRIVGEDGRSVEAGEPGEVVLSNLCNRATVLLNYRLGDRASLATSACPCGRTLPLLQGLEGRVSDILRLSSGREIVAILVVNACEEALRRVLLFQFVESAPGRFRWLVVPRLQEDLEGLERALAEGARRILEERDELAIEFVESLPGGPSAKLTWVARKEAPPSPPR